MPQPTLPPTPASSTDIKGKDGTKDITSLQMAFELPPPAMTSASPARESRGQSSRTEYPVQPSETVKSRRRSSAANKEAKIPFELPPPPTRSRKIIQMKPKKQEEKEDASEKTGTMTKATGAGSKSTAASSASSSSSSSTATATASAAGAAGGSKKKQPSATSAAGRKIARKTAHSLIERRRRSKMNEEFAVLKSMIPACTGEMHKLAILQASIEYVRYLEDCVSKLKAEREEREPSESSEQSAVDTPTIQETYASDARHHHHHHHHNPHHPQSQQHAYSAGHSNRVETEPADVEMTGSTVPSPTYSNAPSSHRASISPALQARDASPRRESYSSSVSAEHHRRFSYTTSATTSPAFGPQTAFGYGAPGTLPSLSSALTSPALGPQGDADHEATAALLMLNTDRRGYFGQRHLSVSQGENGPKPQGGAGRGMSVRDLLST